MVVATIKKVSLQVSEVSLYCPLYLSYRFSLKLFNIRHTYGHIFLL